MQFVHSLRNLWHHKHINSSIWNKFYFRAIISYLIVVVILIACMNTIILFFYSHTTEQDILENNEVLLTQIQATTDKYFLERIDSLLSSFQPPYNQKSLERFFDNSATPQDNDLLQIEWYLSNIIQSNSFIHNIYVFNSEKGTLISPKDGVIEDLSTHSDPMMLNRSFFQYIKNIEHDFTVTPMHNKENFDGDDILTFVHVVNSHSQNSAIRHPNSVVICVNITDVIKFMDSSSQNSGNIAIFSPTDGVIAHSNTDDLYYNTRAGKPAEFNFISDSPNGYESVKYNGEKFGLMWSKSHINDWYYVCYFPLSLFSKNIMPMQILVLLLSILITVLVAFIGSKMTKYLLRPIQALIGQAKLHTDFGSLDNLESINAIINRTENESSENSSASANVTTLEISTAVEERLTNQISEEIFAERLEQAGAALQTDEFCLMLIDINPKSLRFSNAANNTSFEKIKKLVCTVLSSPYCAQTSSHVLSVLIEHRIPDQAILSLLSKELNKIKLEHNILFSYPVTPAKCPSAFAVVNDLCKYKYIFEYGNHFHAETLLEFEENTPNELESFQRLEQYLSNNCSGSFYQLFDALITDVYIECRSYAYAQRLILYIFSALCRSMQRCGLENDDLVMADLLRNDSFTSAAHQIRLMTKKYFAYLNDKKENLVDSLAEQITQYVEEHISSDISLTSVAEHFNVSPSYLSRLFKSAKNITFSKFIIDCKFSFAQKLLEEHPEISVSDVSNKVGYFDVAYFTRQFKKRYGITPIQYQSRFLKDEE
ncbi:MAG: AraC family transcriptional regulator [Monoglobaceae bacterium]